MRTAEQLESRAIQLAHTFHNGNRSDVRDELESLSGTESAYLALQLANLLSKDERRVLVVLLYNKLPMWAVE